MHKEDFCNVTTRELKRMLRNAKKKHPLVSCMMCHAPRLKCQCSPMFSRSKSNCIKTTEPTTRTRATTIEVIKTQTYDTRVRSEHDFQKVHDCVHSEVPANQLRQHLLELNPGVESSSEQSHTKEALHYIASLSLHDGTPEEIHLRQQVLYAATCVVWGGGAKEVLAVLRGTLGSDGQLRVADMA
mmetsp:Transcript_88220/g.234591  ORF Transcript_88220/g.234591 Transcript_88220/m.234591 type:complete len:185 (+) Transcript_88220:90-644(+)